MKISNYTQATSFDDGDFLIKDGPNGTKIIKASDAANAFFNSLVDASMHANVYRGKNLGTVITDAQKAAITNGTFKDLFVGDYWTINGTVYRIADMDYFYNVGDTACTKHHLVIVPDTQMYAAQMNETNITTGGYVGSKMYTTNLTQAKTKISTDFGSMLITHRDYLVNAVDSSGGPSGGAWMDSQVELMNEIMVYGCHIRAKGFYTTAKKQLSIFRLNPKALHKRQTYWLRDSVSSASFAFVYYFGSAHYDFANFSFGVRPYFIIG